MAPSLWFDCLSSGAKERTRRHLGLRDVSREAFLEFMKQFRGAKVCVKGSVVKIEMPQGRVLPKLSTIGRNVVGISLQHDEGRFVYIQPPGMRYGMYFVQMNRTNLRQFTGVDGRDLNDKSYRDLAKDLNECLDAALCATMLGVIIEGFREELTSGLTPRQEELLCDVGGIYMAEAFRLIRRGARGKVVQRIPSALVMTLYFRGGGLDPEGSIGRRGGDSLPVWHFASRHSEFIRRRVPYDQAITAYVKANHGGLYAGLREYLTDDGPLLDALGRYCEEPGGSTDHFRKLLAQFLLVVEKEAGLMTAVSKEEELALSMDDVRRTDYEAEANSEWKESYVVTKE